MVLIVSHGHRTIRMININININSAYHWQADFWTVVYVHCSTAEAGLRLGGIGRGGGGKRWATSSTRMPEQSLNLKYEHA